ncbi:two pore domain potassium channel family protein [bacterium SCSIO 12741]|nr:two pore domain potassium channel family protein [bacterium SCSIO 12741]
MIKKWIKKENRFLLLFLATLASLVLPTFFRKELLADTLFVVTFSAMVLAGIHALKGTPVYRLSIYGGVLTIALSWLASFQMFTNSTAQFQLFTFLFYFAFLFYYVLSQVIREKEVNADVIYGSITCFFLLGYVGGIYFITLENFLPGSFDFPFSEKSENLIYFSFVTVTTLGYGDITPLSHAAQRSSVVLAIAGQFYMAVVVATLVSKWANGRK